MEKFDAIHCPLRGSVFIEASAGTGKTHSITSLVMRLVLEQHVEMQHLLLVTYTNAATDELKRKTRDRLTKALRQLQGEFADDELGDLMLHEMGEKQRIDREAAILQLRQALLSFDELSVLTIHGFCQRVLRDRAFESGHLFTTALAADELPFIEQAVYDFWRQILPNQSEAFFTYLRQRGRGVKDLLGLAQQVLRRTDAGILPRPQGSSLLKSHEENLAELIDEARGLLSNQRAEIIAAIHESEINRSSYHDADVDRWLNNLDEWLCSPCPLPGDNQALRAFANESLGEATTKGKKAPVHEFFDLCDSILTTGTETEDLLDALWIQLKRDLLVGLRETLPNRKLEANCFAYDDLLQNALAALKEDGSPLPRVLAEQFPVILIDEFQDTDPTQYAIFRRVHECEAHQLLCLIGDPKQAIYAFRGGDVYTYTHARRCADYLATLRHNWRSSDGLIHAINTVFQRPPRPFWSADIAYYEVRPPEIPASERALSFHESDAEAAPLQIWHVNGNAKSAWQLEEACVKAVSQEIVRLIQLGRSGDVQVNGHALQPSDIAILIRSHSQADRLQKALQQLGVNTVSYDRHHIFETHDAENFETFLRAIAAPKDGNLLKALLLSDLMGYAEIDLEQLLADEGQWGALLERVASYRTQWKSDGFVVMFRRFLREERLPQRLLGLPNGERRLTNTLQLSELTEEARVAEKLSLSATLKWFADQRHSALSEEKELRLESDDDRVKILTIHRSKGLEFPVVFVPFAWRGMAPRKSPEFVAFHLEKEEAWHRFIDVGSDRFEEHALMADSESLAEELRMTYVAFTRAQHRLYVCWAVDQLYYKTSSLAYLWHHKEADANRPLESFRTRLEPLSTLRLREDVMRLVANGEGAIAFKTWDGARSASLMPEEIQHKLKARQFIGSVDKSWGITSYSSLAGHSGGLEHPDYDAFASSRTPSGDAALEGIFALPRGTRTGNMLHQLYENLCFQSGPTEILDKVTLCLSNNNLSVDDWGTVVSEHTLELFACDLGEGVRLANVTQKQRLNELEFHFQISKITVLGLETFFETHGLPWRQDRFDFYPVEGFLKGFIDLVFECQGKFYVADYKSNFLGGQIEDYHHDRLLEAMQDSNYVLQYHLYVVALHRYLQYRLGDRYKYDVHMGGVFYLFVRGIAQSAGPDFGVYRDRPSRQLIESLSKHLIHEPVS